MNTTKGKLKKIGARMLAIILNDELYASSAQLSYALIMAMIPLVMFVITLAGRFNLPMTSIYDYLSFILPKQSYAIVTTIIDEIISSSSWSLITFFSCIYCISIATRGFMRISNKAYKTVNERGVFLNLLVSLVFAVIIIAVIILSLIVVIFGDLILSFLFGLLKIEVGSFYTLLRYFVSYVSFSLLLSLIYYLAPARFKRNKFSLVGGFVSALFWLIGSAVFGIYVNNFSNYGILFGSLGGIFLLFVWLYWTSLILLIGLYINVNIYNVNREEEQSLVDSKKLDD